MNHLSERPFRFGIFDHMDDAGIGMARQFADRLDLAELCIVRDSFATTSRNTTAHRTEWPHRQICFCRHSHNAREE
jgi:hypothetical protein